MDNDNSIPPLVVGTVPEKCYATWQEVFEAFAANLRLPTDTISIIEGAKGDPGATGPRGNKGDPGQKGDGSIATVQTFGVVAGVQFIDIPYFSTWKNASFRMTYNGLDDIIVGPEPSPLPEFNQAAGIVGVGTIVGVYSAVINEATAKLRVYFTFFNCTSTPDGNFQLLVTDYR